MTLELFQGLPQSEYTHLRALIVRRNWPAKQ